MGSPHGGPSPSIGTHSPRLGLLSGLRLGSNGSFRYLYPFLAVVAADLRIPDAGSGILLGALALGGMLSPLLRRALVGTDERPRRLLVTSSIVVAVGTVAIAVAPVAALGVLALLVLGVGKPLLDTAAISYVSARVAFDRRARATSIMELTWAGSLIVIAPVAGVLADATSWRVPLVVLAAAIAATGILAHRVLDADDPPASAPPVPGAMGSSSAARWPRRLFGGMSSAGRDYLLVVAFAFGALEATFSVFGLWLDRIHDVPLEQLGGFAAVVAFGELLGAGTVSVVADRLGKARTLVAGLVTCSLGLGALAMTTSLAAGVAALAVGLVGSEIAIVTAIAVASEVQPAARSHYLAVLFAVTSFTRAVVGGAGPAVFTAVGIRGNVAMSIAAALVAALFLRRAVARSPHLAG